MKLKFTLVEHTSDKNTEYKELLENSADELLSLAENDIVNFMLPLAEKTNQPVMGRPMFVTKNGDILVADSSTGKQNTHTAMATTALIFYIQKETGLSESKILNDIINPIWYEFSKNLCEEIVYGLTDELGWVRLNPGTTATAEYPYIVLPDQITNVQKRVVFSFIENLQSAGIETVEIIYKNKVFHPRLFTRDDREAYPGNIITRILKYGDSDRMPSFMFEKYYKHYREKHNLDEYAEKNTYTFTVIHPNDRASYESIEAYSMAQAKLLAHKKWPRCYIRELKEQPVEKAQTEIDLAQFAGGTK